MKRFITFLTIVAWPGVTLAHGVGQRIDLPLPVNYYLIGAGLTVAISFLLIGLIPSSHTNILNWRYNLLSLPLVRAVLLNPILGFFVKMFFVLLTLLLIVAGFIGTPTPVENITPVVIWILFGVGLTYVSALLGNVWPLIHPWKIIVEWYEKLRQKPASYSEWPKTWSMWPALLLFFTYRWVENVALNADAPQALSIALLLYGLVSIYGISTYGAKTWLRYGDPFNVFFGFLARFAITEWRYSPEPQLNLRLPGSGLVNDTHDSPSLSQTLFILFMLSSVAFDGVVETKTWYAIAFGLFERGLTPGLIDTMGILGLLGIFYSIYYVFCWLIQRAAKSTLSPQEITGHFAYSLLPIAIAYELAHFVTLLVIEGQRIIPLSSDPFGFGWDIFGTANYQVNYLLINLKNLWNWQVGLIIVGHIIAVYVAHITALKLFKSHHQALVSQYPMLVLMVLYTILSLWIIAQPLVATEF